MGWRVSCWRGAGGGHDVCWRWGWMAWWVHRHGSSSLFGAIFCCWKFVGAR
eukprot:CCRYP_018148-RA/>CCRYP_018148-RA protein AED:0.46 eAED:0.46 QI:21/1/1/1/0/0/2/111/50